MNNNKIPRTNSNRSYRLYKHKMSYSSSTSLLIASITVATITIKSCYKFCVLCIFMWTFLCTL